jgi:hippurate hydrolase
MLLGAAKYLSENRNFDGKVHLIFQPAEEGQGGAHKMIAEGLFDRFPCDQVFGMHNWPVLPKGKIAMRAGPIMAAADRFDITIRGAGGHAAQPHRGVDPLLVGAQLVVALQTLISRSIDPIDPAVITIANFNCGSGAFNVIADEAELNGTLRTFTPEVRDLLRKRITEMTQDIARSFGATATCEFEDGAYDPTINDADATEFCAEVARGIVGAENVDTNVPPTPGAEDFGAMLQQVPGCYIFVGQGEEDTGSHHNQGLHTPRYDFNDDIIPMGVEYWVRVVEQALPVK